MNYVDMADLCPYLGLFFAIQVFERLRAEEAPLGCLDEPLVAVLFARFSQETGIFRIDTRDFRRGERNG